MKKILKYSFLFKTFLRFISIIFLFLNLTGCISKINSYQSSGIGYSTIWNVENYPPREVIENSNFLKNHNAYMKNMPNDCNTSGNFLALKLLSFDEYENSYSSSAVSIIFDKKIYFITNRHSVHGKSGYFLIDWKGNYSEATLEFKYSNIFTNFSDEDTVKGNSLVDVAILKPVKKGILKAVPKNLIKDNNFSVKVFSMGFPDGKPSISVAHAYFDPKFLVIYDENISYSLPGSSGGGVYDCQTGSMVGLTFSTPYLPLGINLKTGDTKLVYKSDQLKNLSLISNYSMHSKLIEHTILQADK